MSEQPSPPRDPRYGRFIATGALLGVVLGLLAGTTTGPTQYEAGWVYIYLAAVFGLVGAIVGGGVAVLLDSRARRARRARRDAAPRRTP